MFECRGVELRMYDGMEGREENRVGDDDSVEGVGAFGRCEDGEFGDEGSAADVSSRGLQ